MITLTYKEHYDDDNLRFNTDTGRYELTLQYAKAQFDNPFTDDGELVRRITKNSRKIYNYIYAHSNSYNKEVIEFALNRTEEGRKFLLDVLTEQMEADCGSGYNDLSNTPAINFQTGQVIDRNELFRNQISVDTEQLLDRSVNYFGINLLYASVFDPYIFIFVRKIKGV